MRTTAPYLSFEMEQIVEGEERLVIGLSKMIKKNSGGEGRTRCMWPF